MSIGTWRACAVLVTLVVLTSATPASAEPVTSPELDAVPAVLGAELSATEKQSLSALTDGAGVQLEAFVVTPEGPEIITLDADSSADAEAATHVLEAQPSVQSAGLTVPAFATAGALAQYGNTMLRSTEALAEVDNPLSDVVVAVLDTGVAPHAELTAAMVPGQNFTDSPGGSSDTTDRHGHGTHVAGTVAADAGSQVEGVAPGVRIMPVKVLGDGGSGYSNWISGGIIWAADNGADVINMSLGGSSGAGTYSSSVAYARSKGVTVIAAAGNDNSGAPHYPSGEAGVISVAAVDEGMQKASFSNYGPTVDLAAPGVAITSTDRSGGYVAMSGTSMASPHVAGVAALVKAAAPGLTPDQVEQAIIASVADLGAAGRDDIFGHGLVSALTAVRAANAMETGTAPTPVSAPTDLSIVHRFGYGMNLWRLSMLESGAPGARLLASMNYGGFSYDRSVTVPGDFGAVTSSDDGSPDEIIWHAQPNGGVLVWAVGGGTDPTPKLWRDLRTGGWSWALSRPMAGDVTGDGIDDLVVRHANGPWAVNLWVLRGNGQTVGAPELWASTTGGLDQRAELADVDGDGRDDVVLARPVSGSSGLVYDVMRASGSSFGPRTSAFHGAISGGWSPASRLAAGDVTGDGRVDLVTSHAQLGNPGLLVWVHENCSTGTGVCFRAPQIWQDLRAGGWSYTASRQYLADTDADGDADVISLHAQQGNPGLLVWRHRSDGSRLLTPQIAADLRAGGWSYVDSRAALD